MSNKKEGVNINTRKIKIIAVLAMLTDHLICQYYGPDFFCVRDVVRGNLYDFFGSFPAIEGIAIRCIQALAYSVGIIGRMAAVLFFLLLANGFQHTKDVRKYIGRLLFFGVLAQIPYTLFGEGHLIPITEMRFNIMFTMAVALFALWCSRRLKSRPVIAAMVVDFDIRMVTTIGMYIAGHCLAVLLTLKYNGEKGKQSKAFQYFFYGFYPGHLLVLGLIQMMLYRVG